MKKYLNKWWFKLLLYILGGVTIYFGFSLNSTVLLAFGSLIMCFPLAGMLKEK